MKAAAGDRGLPLEDHLAAARAAEAEVAILRAAIRAPVARVPGRSSWRYLASVSAPGFVAASVLFWVNDGERLELPRTYPMAHVKKPSQRLLHGRIGSAEPVQAQARQALACAEHKIVFKHRALGEVAAEFNRYGSIPVEIEDAALRALPVSGMLDAGDTESFVAFLKTLPGVRVERTPTRVRVVRVPP